MSQSNHLLYPLNLFYNADTFDQLQYTLLKADQLPDTAHTLLVHRNDMTPTLEQFYRSRIRLEVLHRRVEAEQLFRQVILRTEDEVPVIYGAIEINLNTLPTAAAEEVLACQRPFGAIMRTHAVAHSCHPQHFFSVRADGTLAEALNLQPHQQLYGRVNHMLTAKGETLIRVVEILPKGQ